MALWQIIVGTIVIIIVLIMIYVGYQITIGKEVLSFNPLTLTVGNALSSFKIPKLNVADVNQSKCTFLDSDIYNKKVQSIEGELVVEGMLERNPKVGNAPDKHRIINCNDCKKYLYKTDKGCSQYENNLMYSISGSLGVCTAKGFPKPCEEFAKILR
jgi:hypothetical protein